MTTINKCIYVAADKATVWAYLTEVDIPEDDPAWQMFKDRDWPVRAKVVAAYDAMLDRQVGEVAAAEQVPMGVRLVKALVLEERSAPTRLKATGLHISSP